jgi:pyridoxamine 5'-phosphate oxidase
MAHLADLRKDYRRSDLGEADLAPDPFEQFSRWFTEAEQSGVAEPNAMILATASAQGRPSARTVLLKGVDARGFVFYTNYESRKGTELAANPRATLLFPWHPLERLVIVEGAVSPVSREDSEAYFVTRPRGSQIAAWASPQSRPLGGRAELEEAMQSAEARFSGAAVPVPPFWGGFRVMPDAVEFWQGRPNRLHDRLCYRRESAGTWIVHRLAP